MACLVNADGEVISTGRSSSSNPNNIGYEQAALAIQQAVQEALPSLHNPQIQSACLGIAGIATKGHRAQLEELLREQNWAKLIPFKITHDIEIALEGGLSGRPGICLISGTGSSCFGKDGQGRTARSSGRSAGEDDPGSGYAIGLAACKSGMATLPSDDRDSVASIAPEVITQAESGNVEAREILAINADALGKLFLEVEAQLELRSPLELVLAGGLLENDSLYSKLLKERIANSVPSILIHKPEGKAAEAAAMIAARLAVSGNEKRAPN